MLACQKNPTYLIQSNLKDLVMKKRLVSFVALIFIIIGALPYLVLGQEPMGGQVPIYN